MKVYKTGGFKELIEIVEVDRVSNKSVWINGRRTSKRSIYCNYWDTMQNAKQHLLENLKEKIKVHNIHIQCAQKEIELINKKY